MTDTRDRSAYSRKRSATLQAKGVCTSCGKRPLRTAWLCDPCEGRRRAAQARRDERLRTSGLCVNCGNPCQQVDRTLCDPCLADRARWQVERKAGEDLRETSDKLLLYLARSILDMPTDPKSLHFLRMNARSVEGHLAAPEPGGTVQ